MIVPSGEASEGSFLLEREMAEASVSICQDRRASGKLVSRGKWN